MAHGVSPSRLGLLGLLLVAVLALSVAGPVQASHGRPLEMAAIATPTGTSTALPATATPSPVPPANLDPIVVNAADDLDDGCTAGHCSLREAINLSNARPGHDTIAFALSGLPPFTLQPLSPLPAVTDALTIDGTTQPGFQGTPIVVLNGARAGSGASGLVITGGGSTIKDLVVNGFADHGTGIMLRGGSGHRIQGCYIGLDADGATSIPNGHGMYVSGSADNTIGGTEPGAGNVISGNSGDGIILGSPGNVVQGNFIGTNAAGTAAVGNGLDQVWIAFSSNNVIGGTTATARNVISGNAGMGVMISGNTTETAGIARQNVVQGNFIGTDVSGTIPLGNAAGVYITDSPENQIGGSAPGAGNVISASGEMGVFIDGLFSTGNRVQGNNIGTDATGTIAMGNSHFGVLILHGRGNTIGGEGPGAGNLFAHNGGGVHAYGGEGNRILSNRIHSNGSNPHPYLSGLGIDLDSSGVNPNDIGDGDTGGNKLQNFPVLDSAATSGASITVGGALSSTPNTAFLVQLFASRAADPSGHGEGEIYLGSTEIATDGSGNAGFLVTLPVAVPAGYFITATATDPNGNTSEFSRALAAAPAPATPTPGATPTPSPTSPIGPISPTPTPTPTVQRIALHQGWNWISLAVEPPDPTLPGVLASIDGRFDMVLGETGSYAPPPAMDELNNLRTLEPPKGYFLRMTEAGEAVFQGSPLPVDSPIRIPAGWHWIGYLPPAARDLPAALDSLCPAGGVCDFDYLLGETGTYSPTPPYPGANTLARMEPGGGYLIRMRQEATLVYGPDR